MVVARYSRLATNDTNPAGLLIEVGGKREESGLFGSAYQFLQIRSVDLPIDQRDIREFATVIDADFPFDRGIEFLV